MIQPAFSLNGLNMIWALAWKNIRVKYKNSILGLLWSLINPLIFLLIFSYVFGTAFKEIENYRLFALTGLILWSIFPVATTQMIQSVLDGAPILKSLSVSTMIFPMSAMVSSLIQFLFTLIPFSGLMIYFGYQPSPELLFIIPVIILYLFFILGISLVLCAVNIYFRDVGLLWNTMMPAIFYFTPIAYPLHLIPENIQWILQLNPVFHFIQPFREIIYLHQIPGIFEWVTMCFISFICLITGLIIFKKLERGFIAHY
jgi:ABC-type polysaccharide/polyol phosphate export permease